MMIKQRALMTVLLAALVALAGGVTTSQAGPGHHGGHEKGDNHKGRHHHKQKTRTYTLPANAGNPEGVAFDRRGGAFYVSEAQPGSDGVGGRVWRGTLDDPTLEPFLPASPTRPATIGMKASRGKLYVAGGPAGDVEVYDLSSKALTAQFQLCSSCFVNDLTVARNGDVYVTESQVGTSIYRIPAGGGPAEAIPVAPPVVPTAAGPNENGIAVSRSGRWVVFVQSNPGKLFRLDTRTDKVREIPVKGGVVTNGDGIVLHGRTLYVVRNRDQLIAKLKLSRKLRKARVIRTKTDSSFEDPTTAALVGKRLLVVNSDFFPPPIGAPFTVSSIGVN
jgi:sugar lactone lactonase YvrE